MSEYNAIKRIPTPMGQSIPAYVPHGISVSLPTWQDNIGYEEGDPRVVDKMTSGYPRFKIHWMIEKLADFCHRKFGLTSEKCHLYPTLWLAEECRSYMNSQSPGVAVRLARLWIHPPESLGSSSDRAASLSSTPRPSVELHIVLFSSDAASLAKSFWQHTGTGISSRMAEYCLTLLPSQEIGPSTIPAASPVQSPGPKNRHKRYNSLKKGSAANRPETPENPSPPVSDAADDVTVDLERYLEERYARNLPFAEAPTAKRALRRRIAGVLVPDISKSLASDPCRGITEDDVFVFPSGMSAIWYAHRAILGASSTPSKSVCFGFPYTDTLKILEKWGPGCHFIGNVSESDLGNLENLLKNSRSAGTPIFALWCEFPSNPLLRSPPLVQLRRLADLYGFLIVIDETIASFANVEVLPFVDVIVSSLSKVFSGGTNVLGGSLVLNPASNWYTKLQKSMAAIYEDFYWIEDAVYMERNSRDFAPRVSKMNRNTETLCDYLHSRSLATLSGSDTDANSRFVIKEVFYPKWTTRDSYDECRIGSPAQSKRSALKHKPLSPEDGGFGMLFSITFISDLASQVFYDTLRCEKGPSLGTNFTLACPYTILAHYFELDWAAQFGVEKGLVRVSIGLEDEETLKAWFEEALNRAEEAVKTTK